MICRPKMGMWIFACAVSACACVAASADAPPEGDQLLDTVEVTGSHIRGIDVETQHPVITIDRTAIERSGLTNVADIVQRIVANGESQNRNINNSSDGEQLVSLRNLGHYYTLVLLNGQRFVSDINGAVDLSAIPLTLVERIEVLLDGASAIYGSDAIAGVVNIVTRRNFNGGEFGAYYGQNDYDDGAHRQYNFTFGQHGDRWSASGGVEWGREDPIFAANRAISSLPVFGLPTGATGSGVTPYSWLTLDTGEKLRLIDGRPGTSPDDFRPVQKYFDRFNFATQNYLQTPQQRRAVFAQARYEFSGTLAANVDVLYNERRSAQQLASPVLHFNLSHLGAPDAIGIPVDNLYNPFGEPVDAVDRRLIETGPRRQEQTADTLRLHAGLDGLFHLLNRDFLWGVDATSTQARVRRHDGPYGDNSKLALALGPSFLDANGTPRCGTPNAPIADCVPWNIFGPPGSITPQMLDYATVFETNRTRNDTRVFAATLSTDRLFDLPAGPLAFAAGVEHRRESKADLLDTLRASGNENGNGVTSLSTDGAYLVAEAYLEAQAPLLVDKPFARKLDLIAGTRYSHYSNFGGTTNSQLGLRWRPIEDLLVRANMAQGFRAPSIDQLLNGGVFSYLGTASGGNTLADPCDPANGYGAATLARCAALGVPAGLDSSAQIGLVNAVGNPALRPETSRSRGIGFVYAPAWLEGFELSIDWYNVRIREYVYDPSAQGVLDACYYFGSDSNCAQVARNPANGTIEKVIDKTQNYPGGLEAEGIDLALHWHRNTPIGRVRVDATANHVLYLGEIGQPAPGTPLADGSAAYGNIAGLSLGGLYNATWRWRAQTTVTLEHGAWTATIGTRYFAPLDENCQEVAFIAGRVGDQALLGLCSDVDHPLQLGYDFVPRNHLPSVTYFDFDLGWEAPWRARLSVGVVNAFDRNPPVAYSAYANSFLPDYDVPGRFLYASYRQAF